MAQTLSTVKEQLAPRGMVEIFVSRKRPVLTTLGLVPNKHGLPIYHDHKLEFKPESILDIVKIENILVNVGKDAVISSLVNGSIKTLARLAVGDNGTIPSDSTVPKVPVPTMTALYNEVGRADAEAVILNVGTPSIHEVKFVKTFAAADFPITAFFNQAKPALNEVGLIMIDPAAAPLPRLPDFGPYNTGNHPLEDEVLFTIRTHKSVPFEAANDISVTYRYTIFIE